MGRRSGVVLLVAGLVLLAAHDRVSAVLGTSPAELVSVGRVCLAAGALTIPVDAAVRRLRARRPTATAVLADAVPPL